MDVKIIKSFWQVLKLRMEWFNTQAVSAGWVGEFIIEPAATPEEMFNSGLSPDAIPDDMIVLFMTCAKSVIFHFKKDKHLIGAPEAVWDLNYLKFCSQVSDSFNIVSSYVDGEAEIFNSGLNFPVVSQFV